MGEAVHAIRSSLDYFAYAADPSEDTSFPVMRSDRALTAAEVQTYVDAQMKGASKQLRKALRDLQPYPGGNGEYVWLINYLDVIDKHRLLITTGTVLYSVNIDAAAMLRGLADWTKDLPAMAVGLRPVSRHPIKEGTVLFTASADYFEKYGYPEFPSM